VALIYEVVTRRRAGRERVHRYASDDPLSPGDLLRLDGRDWLIETIEQDRRAVAKPARYRIRLVYPDGHEDLGVFRRYRPGSPRFGHSFATVLDGRPVSWEVVDARLAHDADGEPFLDLVAGRDFGEQEDELPNHELEHALAAREAELPEGAIAAVARAREAGLAIELVALEPGEEPDWDASRQYIEHLVQDMIEDDLIELCGVDPDVDPPETWLEKVKERLRADLDAFRADIEGDHDEIEEWDYLDGSIFASVGTIDDESNPDSGHGWMCRLLDASPLVTAGFARMRRAELES
jgi:hypothetical protein